MSGYLVLGAIVLAVMAYRIGQAVGFAHGLRHGWGDRTRGDDD